MAFSILGLVPFLLPTHSQCTGMALRLAVMRLCQCGSCRLPTQLPSGQSRPQASHAVAFNAVRLALVFFAFCPAIMLPPTLMECWAVLA